MIQMSLDQYKSFCHDAYKAWGSQPASEAMLEQFHGVYFSNSAA
jgi:hypothetical protein